MHLDRQRERRALTELLRRGVQHDRARGGREFRGRVHARHAVFERDFTGDPQNNVADFVALDQPQQPTRDFLRCLRERFAVLRGDEMFDERFFFAQQPALQDLCFHDRVDPLVAHDAVFTGAPGVQLLTELVG
jgi:hypothetical protein